MLYSTLIYRGAQIDTLQCFLFKVFEYIVFMVYHSDERRTKHFTCIVSFIGKADYLDMSYLKYLLQFPFRLHIFTEKLHIYLFGTKYQILVLASASAFSDKCLFQKEICVKTPNFTF